MGSDLGPGPGPVIIVWDLDGIGAAGPSASGVTGLDALGSELAGLLFSGTGSISEELPPLRWVLYFAGTGFPLNFTDLNLKVSSGPYIL